MKTEFLKELGLVGEQISAIMAENGKDVKKEQDKYSTLEAERDNYKGQLETAQNALKDFEGVDIKELQGRITQLTNDLQTKESEYQTKLTDMEFNTMLDNELSGAKVRNTKAAKALLEMESLKTSKNQSDDIKKAIEALKADNDYLFESNEPIKNPVAPTGGGDKPGIIDSFTKGFRQGAGLKD